MQKIISAAIKTRSPQNGAVYSYDCCFENIKLEKSVKNKMIVKFERGMRSNVIFDVTSYCADSARQEYCIWYKNFNNEHWISLVIESRKLWMYSERVIIVHYLPLVIAIILTGETTYPLSLPYTNQELHNGKNRG